MARPLIAIAVFGLVVATVPEKLLAADQPVAGTWLRLRRSATGERLRLLVKDPALSLPAAGSTDDPAVSAGLRITLFGQSSLETQELVVPPGLGWSEQTSPSLLFRYSNEDAPSGLSPVRLAVLRDGRGLRIVAHAIGLALSAPQVSVGVRIEIGSTRLCTLFADESVRRDQPSLFVGRGAPAPGLVECDETALFGLACGSTYDCGGVCPSGMACGGFPGSCTCVSAAQPCGETAAVCNGQCPQGEVCANVGGVPYSGCACLPEGSTGCGTVYPMCGDGDCPAGLSCLADVFTCCGGFTLSGCACLSGPPSPPCGGPCPPGMFCAGGPGLPEACYPLGCGGGSPCPAGSTCEPLFGGFYCTPTSCTGGSGYPTCDGSCPAGLTCQGFPQGLGSCYCAP